MATWRCPCCTLINSADRGCCEVCNTSQPTIDSRSSTECTRDSSEGTRGSGVPAKGASYVWDLASNILDSVSSVCSQKTPVDSSKSSQKRSHDSVSSSVSTSTLFNSNSLPPSSQPHHWTCSICTLDVSRRFKHCPNGCSSVVATEVPSIPPTSAPLSIPRQKSISLSYLKKSDEELAATLRRRIIALCRKVNTSFVDDEFQPNAKSIYFNPKIPFNSRQIASWRRPCEINPRADWAVFRQQESVDIVQGSLGNCWFLSSLAVLAEKPELLERVMLTKTTSTEGCYQVRLFASGSSKVITIDDFLPCDEKGNPVFSECKKHQLWVPLIEKAAAKLFGCYEALIAGKCVEGLSLLTGAFCETVSLQPSKNEIPRDDDLVWGQLLSAKEAGFLLGASCGSGCMKVDSEEFAKVGLKDKHAYSILDVRNVGSVRLLRLRNPWGHFSWKGEWSDESANWTPSLKDELGAYGNEEGLFWMSFKDFLRYFDSVDICCYQDSWYQVSDSDILPASLNQCRSLHILTVFESCQVNITMFQPNLRRAFLSDCIDIGFIVYRCCGETDFRPNSFVAHSHRQLKPLVTHSVFLEPGTYGISHIGFNHLIPSDRFHQLADEVLINASRPFTLVMYCPKVITLGKVVVPPYALADALITMAMFRGNVHEGRQGMTAYYLSHSWAGLIIVIENRLYDKFLQVICDCQASYNVVSTRDTLITKDCVPPLHRQIVILLSQLEAHSGFSIAHKLIHRESHRSGLGDWVSGEYNNLPLLSPNIEALHTPRPI